MAKYAIWGSSGHGKVLRDLIFENGDTISVLFDNNQSAIAIVSNAPIFFGIEGFNEWCSLEKDHSAYIAAAAIGGANGKVRLNIYDIFKRQGFLCDSIIHSSSVISRSASVGFFSQVLAGVVVASEVKIGNACIINNSVNVDHECIIDDGVHVAPGAILCGCVHVHRNAFIGAGAIVLPRIDIGENSIVGAGAVVTKNIPQNTIVYGNPAKERHQ